MLFLFTKIGQMAHVESRDRHADGDLKSHDIVILSFCNIVNGQAIYFNFHHKGVCRR